MWLFLGVNFLIDLVVFVAATLFGVISTVTVWGILAVTFFFMLGRFATTIIVAMISIVFEVEDPAASYHKPTKPKRSEDLLLYFMSYLTALGGVIFAGLCLEGFTNTPFVSLAEGGLASAKNWIVYALIAIPLSYFFMPKDRL